jgi:hypothetical protein
MKDDSYKEGWNGLVITYNCKLSPVTDIGTSVFRHLHSQSKYSYVHARMNYLARPGRRRSARTLAQKLNRGVYAYPRDGESVMMEANNQIDRFGE